VVSWFNAVIVSETRLDVTFAELRDLIMLPEYQSTIDLLAG